MEEQERIIDKLAKIKALMESCKAIGNEAEAETFAAMLQELLMKHKLEMSDLDYAEEMRKEKIIEHRIPTEYIKDKNGKYRRVYKDFPDIELRSRRVGWIDRLAQMVAHHHKVRILVYQGLSDFQFIGHESNVAICEYVYCILFRAAENLSQKAYVERWNELVKSGESVELCRGFKASFLNGFISRINERLSAEMKKMESVSSGTALMRIDQESLAVKEFMKSIKTISARSVNRGGSSNADGYSRGKAAADKVRLNKGVNKSGSQKNLK